MKNKKSYRSAKPFFQKILKNKEIRIQFEEERSKTEIAHAVRAACPVSRFRTRSVSLDRTTQIEHYFD